jgi:hypothetical protein
MQHVLPSAFRTIDTACTGHSTDSSSSHLLDSVFRKRNTDEVTDLNDLPVRASFPAGPWEPGSPAVPGDPAVAEKYALSRKAEHLASFGFMPIDC